MPDWMPEDFARSDPPPISDELSLLTAQEVAEFFQADASTIYRLMQRGDIPTVRFGRCVRVSWADLVDFVRAHRNQRPHRATNHAIGDDLADFIRAHRKRP